MSHPDSAAERNGKGSQNRDEAGDASSWTFVSPRSRRSFKPRDISHPKKPYSHSSGSRSATSIAEEYGKIRSQWTETSCCVALRKIARGFQDLGDIKSAVCLGLGTFDPPDGGWAAKRRAYVQLIAFLILVEELERTCENSIACIFQDPVFSPSDEAFLISLGHKVVPSPEGFAHIGSRTLLYGVHLYRPVYAMALGGKQLPAIFVGTGLRLWDEVTIDKTGDDLENAVEMERSYGKCEFPQDTALATFSSTTIYWRRWGEAGDDSSSNSNLDTKTAPAPPALGEADEEDDQADEIAKKTAKSMVIT